MVGHLAISFIGLLSMACCAGILGYLVGRLQLKAKERRIAQLEQEMLKCHAYMLDLQRSQQVKKENNIIHT